MRRSGSIGEVLSWALAASLMLFGSAAAQPPSAPHLEAEAAAELARVQALGSESRPDEELAAARRLVDIRDQIEALNKATGGYDADVATFQAHLDWRAAMKRLGEALYKRGRVDEAEALYARLASVEQATRQYELARKGKPDAFTERQSFEEIFRAQVLAGEAAAAGAEQALLDQTPEAERKGDNILFASLQRSYIQALFLRSQALVVAGRLDAGATNLDRALTLLDALGNARKLEASNATNHLLAALERRGRELERTGDRAGASVAFRRAADLAKTRYAPDDIHVRVSRDLSTVAAKLQDRDPQLTLSEAASVFPDSGTMPEAAAKEIVARSGVPTDETSRSDLEVTDSVAKTAIYVKQFGEDDPTTLQHLGFLAHDYREDGQIEKAVEVQTRFVERAAWFLGESNVEVVKERGQLGLMLESAGRAQEALVQLTAVATADAPRVAAADYAAMMRTLGLHRLLVDQGRVAEALPYMQAVAAAARTNPTGSKEELDDDMLSYHEPFFALDRMALLLSDDLRALGRYAEAESWDRTALDLRSKRFGRAAPDTSIAALELAADLVPQPGRAAEAYRYAHEDYAAEAATVRKLWANYEVDFPGFRDAREFAGRGRPTYLDAAFALLDSKAPALTAPGFLDEAFAALQVDFDSSAALAVGHSAARRYALSVGAGDLNAKREALAARSASALAELDIAHGPRGTVAQETRAADMLDANERAFSLLAKQLQAKAPRYASIISQPPLTVVAARALMQPDEAALIVVPTASGTHLVAVTQEAVTWKRSALTADLLSAQVKRLRRDLDPSQSPDGAFDRKTAYALYAALVAPVRPALAGRATLYVVAEGALTTLPLGVLVTAPPALGTGDGDPQTLRSTPWLADAFAIVQIPSLRALADEREFGAKTASRDGSIKAAAYVGYGDPSLAETMTPRRGASPLVAAASLIEPKSKADAQGGAASPLMDPKLLRALPRLPGTRRELEAMRTTLGAPKASLHLGDAMRERTLRTADLSHVSILHIATHGLTSGESGTRAEAGLIFTPPAQATPEDDGFLAASEVAGLNLSSADWVILSACNTAAPAGVKDATGLSGLARAFMLAGARSLLVSHWPVDDAVAARLTVDVLRRAKSPGTTRAKALQEAMRTLRNDPSDPSFALPTTWAPFALVGEGR